MLDLKFIREHPDEVREGLRKKGVEFGLDYFLELDLRRRAKIKEVEDLRAKHNRDSDTTATLLGSERETHVAEMRILKAKLGALEFEHTALEAEFDELARKIPNLPLPGVPVGDERASVVMREAGEKPKFSFKPKDNVELGENLGIIDTARAAKVSGSRFGYLKHEAALLEFALVEFAFSLLTKTEYLGGIIEAEHLDLTSRPFVPVVPPVLVRSEAMRGMGYVERGGDEIYRLERDDHYLVGTSEQSIGPMHMQEVLAEAALPLRYASFSTCFRREAGSYGKDTQGVLRVHQFDKLEMFSLTTPRASLPEHEFLRALEERFLQALGIPYRVLHIASGDLGDPAAAKYDLEAWLPGQHDGRGEYREVTSTSDTTDFQSRRLNIRYAPEGGGAPEFVHMVNGTGFAVGRTIIAILENYQREDGSVGIPVALQPFMHGITEIRR